jgi:hypothetical protein
MADIAIEPADYVWTLEKAVQSEHFPNVWIDKLSGNVCVVDEKLGITQIISIPPAE